MDTLRQNLRYALRTLAASPAFTAAALAATWLPARRGARLDPTEALRAE